MTAALTELETRLPNSPDDGEPRYLSYLLRLWRKRDDQGQPVWCASLEEPGSHQTVRFTDLPALFAFLRTQLGSVQPGGLANEEHQAHEESGS
jgi:hypothetical protein